MTDLCRWDNCPDRRWGYMLVCEAHARTAARFVQEHDERQRVEAVRAAKQRTTHQRQGWIYYLDVGGRLKIGFEKTLHSRLRAYPPDTKVLAYKQGSMADEQAEHQRCQPWRVAGREWYELNDSTRRVVAEAAEIEAARKAAEDAARPRKVAPKPIPSSRPRSRHAVRRST